MNTKFDIRTQNKFKLISEHFNLSRYVTDLKLTILEKQDFNTNFE